MASDNDTVVKLARGRQCRVSTPVEEVVIDGKATFKVGNKAAYRKLLDRFAGPDPIECKTADGISFQLVV